MTTATETPDAAPADPFGGLVTVCKQCERMRAAVKELHGAMSGSVTLTTPDGHDTFQRVSFRCDACKGTGLILTTRGRVLVGIVSLWLADAQPAWLRAEEPIPF